MILINPKRWIKKPSTGVQVNFGHPLASGLVGCFPLNEAGGVKVTNIVSNYQYGFTGTPTWQNSQGGIGLNTASNSTYVFGTAEPLLRQTTAVSVLWRGYLVGTSAANTEYAGVLYNSAVTSPFVGYDVRADGSQLIAGAWNDGSFHSDAGSTAISAFSTYNEHNFVFTLDTANNTQLIYSDNAKVEGSGSFGAGSITYDTTAPFVIGYSGGNNSQAVNLAVYVWNRQISKDQISWLYQEPYAFFTPQSPKLRSFGFRTATSHAITATLESQSTIETSLKANYGLASKLESQSDIQARITVPRVLTALLESQSTINAAYANNKLLTAKLESQSTIEASLGRVLIGGFGALSVVLKPTPPTAYFSTYPRPIAFLKNDNDAMVGVSDESPQVSPGYDVFP